MVSYPYGVGVEAGFRCGSLFAWSSGLKVIKRPAIKWLEENVLIWEQTSLKQRFLYSLCLYYCSLLLISVFAFDFFFDDGKKVRDMGESTEYENNDKISFGKAQQAKLV